MKQSIWDKIQNPDYIENLCDRNRRELEFARSILNEEELQQVSSIDVAFAVARRKYVRENIEPSKQVLYDSRKPIFGQYIKR